MSPESLGGGGPFEFRSNIAEVLERFGLFRKEVEDKALGDALRPLEIETRRLYSSATGSWEVQPDIRVDAKVTAKQARLEISTDRIFHFVDFGTRGGYLIPKTLGGKMLRFQWGGKGSYAAKTRVNWLGSQGGGPSGPVVYRRQVMHPGIAARNFTAMIRKEIMPKLQEIVYKTLERIADSKWGGGG